MALRADEGELEIRRLRPTSDTLSARTDDKEFPDGVLLPAASSLRGLTNRPLGWKVHLSKPPKRCLEYFFLRASFDPDDLDALHNVARTKVYTPPGANFQQNIEVKLTVREDGTAEPRFYYGRDNVHPGTVVAGEPFYMDMTFGGQERAGETYLGFDFGTSTSACSFISSDDVQVIEQRARSQDWRDLAELVSDLPYPVAAPLARYISETDLHRRSELGREAAEALLALAAYISYSEHCIVAANGSVFKGFQHRSAGPLWAMLKQCLKTSANDLLFSAPFKHLLESTNFEQMDEWVSEIALAKHGKRANVDYVNLLSLLANTMAKALGEARLGIFEDVTAKRFSQGRFTGRFRNLAGSGAPFIHVWEYEGGYALSDAEVLLMHPEQGKALRLTPLYFWGLDPRTAGTEPDLYEYDGSKNGDFTFKAVLPRSEFRIGKDGVFAEAWNQLNAIRERDQKISYLTDFRLQSHEF